MARTNAFSKNTLFLISLLVLSSCSSLPIVTSQWHEQAMDPEKNFSHYDPDSRIRYQVSNDSTHLYVIFDTDHSGIQRNIMMSGARISVDTNGKKKGTAYLKYPLLDRRKMQQPERGTRPEDRQANTDRRNQGMQAAGERMPMRAMFVSGEKQYTFDNRIDKTEFETILIRDSTGVLYYLVGIPFKEIHPGGLSAIHNLAVGIEIEASSSPSQMGTMQGGGRMGGGRSGGGGSGGGRPGGGQSAPPDAQRNAAAATSPVKIWFMTSLSNGE